MDGSWTQELVEALPEGCFPAEEEVTDTEWGEGPDFAGMATMVFQMERLGDVGWWSDGPCFDPEEEEVMRAIAPVVGWTAWYMAAGEDCPESPASFLMAMVASCLEMWGHIYASDDDQGALRSEVRALEAGLRALGEKMQARRAAK